MLAGRHPRHAGRAARKPLRATWTAVPLKAHAAWLAHTLVCRARLTPASRPAYRSRTRPTGDSVHGNGRWRRGRHRRSHLGGRYSAGGRCWVTGLGPAERVRTGALGAVAGMNRAKRGYVVRGVTLVPPPGSLFLFSHLHTPSRGSRPCPRRSVRRGWTGGRRRVDVQAPPDSARRHHRGPQRRPRVAARPPLPVAVSWTRRPAIRSSRSALPVRGGPDRRVPPATHQDRVEAKPGRGRQTYGGDPPPSRSRVFTTFLGLEPVRGCAQERHQVVTANAHLAVAVTYPQTFPPTWTRSRVRSRWRTAR